MSLKAERGLLGQRVPLGGVRRSHLQKARRSGSQRKVLWGHPLGQQGLQGRPAVTGDAGLAVSVSGNWRGDSDLIFCLA